MNKLKKLVIFTIVALFGIILFGAGGALATPLFQGFQGGTGIGTTTAGNVGNCLQVSSSSPYLLWTIGACGSGGNPYLPGFITATSSAFTTPLNVSTSLYLPGFLTGTSTLLGGTSSTLTGISVSTTNAWFTSVTTSLLSVNTKTITKNLAIISIAGQSGCLSVDVSGNITTSTCSGGTGITSITFATSTGGSAFTVSPSTISAPGTVTFNFPTNLTGTSVSTTNAFHINVTSTNLEVYPYAGMTILGNIATSTMHGAGWVRVVGRYAYVDANSYGGTGGTLTIVDVIDPSNPQIVGQVGGSCLAYAEGLDISGNYAFVAGYGTNLMCVVDISNPKAPFVAATYPVANPESIAIQGNVAFLPLYSSQGMTALDISNPLSPKLISTFIDAGNLGTPISITIRDKYAYVTNRSGGYGLTIIDISNPANMVFKGRVSPAGNSEVYSVSLSGQYAYIPDNANSTISVVNIASSTNPYIVNTVGMSGAWVLQTAGKYLFVTALYSNAVYMWDISNPTVPVYLSGISDGTKLESIDDVWIDGGYIYTSEDALGSGNGGLSIISYGTTKLGGVTASSILADRGSFPQYLHAGKLNVTGDITAGSQISTQSNIIANGNLLINGVATTTNLSLTGVLNASCLKTNGSGTISSTSCGGAGAGTITTSSAISAPYIPIITSGNTIANSNMFQAGGTTLINGFPIFDGGGDLIAPNIYMGPTTTVNVGNLVQGGGVSGFTGSVNLTGPQFCGTGLAYFSNLAGDANLNLPDMNAIAASPCGSAIYAGSFATQYVYNASTNYNVREYASGTNESILYAPGTPNVLQPGQMWQVTGQFVASSTVQGVTTTPLKLQVVTQLFKPNTSMVSSSMVYADVTGGFTTSTMNYTSSTKTIQINASSTTAFKIYNDTAATTTLNVNSGVSSSTIYLSQLGSGIIFQYTPGSCLLLGFTSTGAMTTTTTACPNVP